MLEQFSESIKTVANYTFTKKGFTLSQINF